VRRNSRETKELRGGLAGLYRHHEQLREERKAQETAQRQADFEKQFIRRRRFVVSGSVPSATMIFGVSIFRGAADPIVPHFDNIREAQYSQDALSRNRIENRAGSDIEIIKIR
jgi:hypothetical protein